MTMQGSKQDWLSWLSDDLVLLHSFADWIDRRWRLSVHLGTVSVEKIEAQTG